MENIKYQVFISSTYSDLKEERKQILDILLMADCIPAGMENFVATDDEQFSVIKKVIDLCDYYILILGRRYGSVNEKTKISYTEMEYDYAISKGIPVLVFALDEMVKVVDDKAEHDDIKRGKLAEFRIKAMRNRLASVWKDQTDLISKVAISIMRAKTEIKRPGWHRGSDEEKERLLSEIKILQQKNEELSEAKQDRESILDIDEHFYGKEIILHYTENVFIVTLNTQINKKEIKTTLDSLFKFISLRITGKKTIKEFEAAISSYVEGYLIEEQDALIVRNIYEQIGLIESFTGALNTEMIRMTKQGIKIMNQLNLYE